MDWRTALTFSNAVLIEQAIAKTERVPQGNRLRVGPADLFKCADGRWLIVPVWWAAAGGEILPDAACGGVARRSALEVISAAAGTAHREQTPAAWCSASTRAEGAEGVRGRHAFRRRGPQTSRKRRRRARPQPAASARIGLPGSPHPAPVVRSPSPLSETPGAIAAARRRCWASFCGGLWARSAIGAGDRAAARRRNRLNARRRLSPLPLVALCFTCRPQAT